MAKNTTVRMLTHITGVRNGEEWPLAGGTITVPAHEAADLIAAGHAEPLDAEETPVETVDVEDSDETVEGDNDASPEDTTDVPTAEDGDETAEEDSEPEPATKPAPRRSRATKK